MAAYFRDFALVEVQQSFYKPPKVQTAARWRAQSSPEFEFTLKAWQLITHPLSSPTYPSSGRAGLNVKAESEAYGFFRPTPEVREAWERTREVAEALRARVVLFQCPASFTPSEENVANLRTFFGRLERGGLVLGWEPRGRWEPELVGALCRELSLVHVVDPFLGPPLSGGRRYFRLHGGAHYRHVYSDDELRWLAGQCSGGDYVLFNNLSMRSDALRFLSILGRGQENGTG